MAALCVVLMGVSGSGKSYIGQMLAEKLQAEFIEGDDYHPAANVAKLRAGKPLNDQDREPWLHILHQQLLAAQQNDRAVVMAASLLKQSYRDLVFSGIAEVRLVCLQGTEACIHDRMTKREHFMPPSLLASQLATLEMPSDALLIENNTEPALLCAQILTALHLDQDAQR